MGRSWSKADLRDLKRFQQQLERLEKTDFDRVCREAANQLAQELWNRVTKRTPVGVPPDDIWKNRKTKVQAVGASGKKRKFFSKEAAIFQQYWSGYKGGTLRDAWTVQPIEKVGDTYTITVINPTEYASYVEYGHRQTPGRYVPALGKRLKVNWVKGRFMLTISEQEVEKLAPAMLERLVYQALKDAFKER